MLLQPRASSCGLEFSQGPLQAEEEREEEAGGEGEGEDSERCSKERTASDAAIIYLLLNPPVAARPTAAGAARIAMGRTYGRRS